MKNTKENREDLPENPFLVNDKEIVWKRLLSNSKPISKQELDKKVKEALILQNKL